MVAMNAQERGSNVKFASNVKCVKRSGAIGGALVHRAAYCISGHVHVEAAPPETLPSPCLGDYTQLRLPTLTVYYSWLCGKM